jgi:hypothetical protein
MDEQDNPTRSISSVAKLVFAAMLLLRIGGFGFGVLPPATLSLTMLVVLLAYERVARDLATDGRDKTLARWREWARRHAFALGLAAITAAALALRMFGIARDLGHVQLGIDENRLNASILHLFTTGEIDYRTVEHYPGIHYWMLSGTYLVAYLWGLMTNVADTLAAMPRTHFVAFGRVVSALQSTATVALTGLLGRRLAGPRVGLLAAGVLALAPLSVSLGQQLRNDAAQTMLIVAAVLVALGVNRRDFSPWEAVVGGGLAGLAAGVKYTGVFVLFPVLLAAATSEDRQRRWRALGLAGCGFLAAALLSNHFVWADLPNLVDQLRAQIAITGEGHWAAQSNPAAYHVRILAQRVVGWPLMLLAAGAVAYHLAAGRWRWWLFATYPLTYIWFVAQRPSQLPRWVYPAAPFAAVAACAGLLALVRFASARVAPPQRPFPRRAFAGAMAVLLLSPLLWAAALDISRQLPAPTYILAERWLEQNSAPGDRVLIERNWLQLDGGRYELNRQRPLEAVLEGGFYELAANDWIVVHEEVRGHPALEDMTLAGAIRVNPSFLGNQGPDFYIFSPPAVEPVAPPLQVMLGRAAADPYLGHQWPARRAGERGRRLPQAGAGLFLPPLGEGSLQLDLVLRRESPDAAPPALEVFSRGRRLDARVTETGASDEVTYTIELSLRTVGPRVVALFLRPAAGGGSPYALRFRLY